MSDSKYREIFSKNLKRLMYERGKMQIDLIRDLGFDKSTVSTWVNGTRLPRMDKVQKLADYFHCERSELIEEQNTKEAEHYYIDDAAREYARFLHDNPEYGVLFDASRKVKAEDIDIVRQLLDKFKESEE